MDTKFGTILSNKMLLNASKFQGYSFYSFLVIKRRPTGEGGEGVKLPSPNQIRVKNPSWQNTTTSGFFSFTQMFFVNQ